MYKISNQAKEYFAQYMYAVVSACTIEEHARDVMDGSWLTVLCDMDTDVPETDVPAHMSARKEAMELSGLRVHSYPNGLGLCVMLDGRLRPPACDRLDGALIDTHAASVDALRAITPHAPADPYLILTIKWRFTLENAIKLSEVRHELGLPIPNFANNFYLEIALEHASEKENLLNFMEEASPGYRAGTHDPDFDEYGAYLDWIESLGFIVSDEPDEDDYYRVSLEEDGPYVLI